MPYFDPMGYNPFQKWGLEDESHCGRFSGAELAVSGAELAVSGAELAKSPPSFTTILGPKICCFTGFFHPHRFYKALCKSKEP